MTNADAEALKIVRQAANGLVPDDVWATVEKQVSEVGVTGLTGTARAIVEGIVRTAGGFEKQTCPPATRNVALNLKNRQKAIDAANYGPLNPEEPNADYWASLAEVFDTTIEEARSSRCGNCAAFDVTSSMKECIAEGIGGDDPWDVVEAGQLGYCQAFKFKCAAARSCTAWVSGGPITD
jgi:hypothetical protein